MPILKKIKSIFNWKSFWSFKIKKSDCLNNTKIDNLKNHSLDGISANPEMDNTFIGCKGLSDLKDASIIINNETSLKRIYADYSSTTPCSTEVMEAMLPYFQTFFGNSSSKSHSFGWEAEEAVEIARERLAKAINSSSKEIIFTSGATESNNIAIKGAYRYLNRTSSKNEIITTPIEHKCVLASCEALEKEGAVISYLKVDRYGIVDLEDLKSKINPKTALVSVIYVNNEIGVIQPISEIAKICKENGVLFHTDAAQALGRVKIDSSEADLMSFSGHKVYAPKGIGALYIKKRTRLDRIISGGGQEKGLRSGTLPVPLCVGFGRAAELSEELREEEWKKTTKLSSYLKKKIMDNLEDVTLNGHPDYRIPHNLHLSFSCVEGESLMMRLKNIALSSGSACTSGSLEPSYVLKAIGLREDLIHTGIRIVLGRYTTMEEVEIVAEKIIEAVNKLRSFSPLWDLKLKGIKIEDIQWKEHH